MSDELKRIIGQRVEALRKEAGEVLSQEELASRLRDHGLKVQQAQIGHIESGTRLPSVPLFVALADHFDTSLDYIAGRTKNESSIAAIEEDLQSGGISGRLGEIYRKLPMHRQQDVYKFAEALQTLSHHEKGGAGDDETRKFVHAMLMVFERRLGAKAIEATLDELAREFPDLASDLDGFSQPRKEKLS